MSSKIDSSWFNSNIGTQILHLVKKNEKLNNFGLLEKPALSPPYSQYEEVYFKIAMLGSSYCGKTSFLESLFQSNATSILSDASYPSQNYIETPGIQINHFYWPVKFVNSDRFMIFDLAVWDIGKQSSVKYEYIKPSYNANLNLYLFIFSWTDKQSFLEIYDQIKRIYYSNLSDQKKLPMLIIGTKFDQIVQSDIEPELVNDLENLAKTKIVRFSSQNCSFDQIYPIMNRLCEILWDNKQISLNK